MNVCSGRYLNLFTDLTKEDSTDLPDDSLDIMIAFAEWVDEDKVVDMEERARNAIEKWKEKYYPRVDVNNPRAVRSISHKINKVLEREFEEEAIFVHVEAEQTLLP